ncbi:MAG: NADH-quinone oxidoreductase subunit NuoF, partial [Planctomycetaceae bacterium]|nr:NADH-quinone oxidoreductase subunit NuoF [Planctomycetaceae bacterium]
EAYLKRGGYEGARKALKNYKPEEVTEYVKKANLRGRGGAGFPAGMKWSFIPKTDKPKYLCVNADESEPGTFKDRQIMAWDPHLLLEGIMICCYAIDCHHAYIFVRGEFTREIRVLREAIKELHAKGWLGDKTLDANFKLDITVTGGAGAYICGEETGLISAQEGGRAYPKIKPPFPAVEGFFRNPTIVNNVETLACVGPIFARGVEWFTGIGPKGSPGPKLFCLSGHVKRPGHYEAPMGIPLRELIYGAQYGQGVIGELKAVIPGGSSMPVFTKDKLDTPMDMDSVKAAGSFLGSAGVIVMNESTCMVNALYNLSRFYHHESCGQCTPCREGTGWLERVLHRVEFGHGHEGDLDLLNNVASQMERKTICFLADSIVMPVHSYIKQFREEFEYHIQHKRCMTGTPAGVFPFANELQTV